MKNNEIDCFDTQDGQLIYTKKNVKNPLSKKHLLKSLTEFFKNDKSNRRAIRKIYYGLT